VSPRHISLQTPPAPSIGIPDAFPNMWLLFVQAVLDITVEAYQRMREQVKVRPDWEEDHFTINLGKIIQSIGFHHELNLMVQVRGRTHTTSMYQGTTSAKEAKEIDIRLWGRWENYDDVYFAWECKRIGEGRINPSHKNLISQYIDEGMMRFIEEEYGKEVDTAGMLGYVMSGDVSRIVRGINRSMRRAKVVGRLSDKDNLRLATPIAALPCVYESRHVRTQSHSGIRLHHLFLEFDFAS
jgi:hypothetical protein